MAQDIEYLGPESSKLKGGRYSKTSSSEQTRLSHQRSFRSHQQKDSAGSFFDNADQIATAHNERPSNLWLEAAPLETLDVFCLIFNKMVGTGIFTSPPLVLVLTGDWRVALGLWAVGFVHTLLRYVEPTY